MSWPRLSLGQLVWGFRLSRDAKVVSVQWRVVFTLDQTEM